MSGSNISMSPELTGDPTIEPAGKSDGLAIGKASLINAQVPTNSSSRHGSGTHSADVSRQVCRQAETGNKKHARSANGAQPHSRAGVDAHNTKPNFRGWGNAFQCSEILPGMPHDVALSPSTKVSPKSRGKVPGRFLPRDVTLKDGTVLKAGWLGFGKWTEFHAEPEDLERWQGWPNASVSMQTRILHCWDVDVNDAPVSKAIEQTILEVVGDAPIKFQSRYVNVLH
jgi:hypothetical protein